MYFDGEYFSVLLLLYTLLGVGTLGSSCGVYKVSTAVMVRNDVYQGETPAPPVDFFYSISADCMMPLCCEKTWDFLSAVTN